VIQESSRFEPFQDSPIRVLSDAGEWIAPFELDLSNETLVALYRQLVTARRVDERLVRLQRQGKSSFVAPGAGHEGIQIAIANSVRVGQDWLFPYYRDYGMACAAGVPLHEIFGQMLGTLADPSGARQMPSHPTSAPLKIFSALSPIASHIPPAVGAGIAQKLAGKGDVTIVSFGDGATSEGDWHAAMNFAGVQGVPVVFVCENNRYAISVEFQKQSGSDTIAEKARAYGMPGYRVDGMDVLASLYLLRELVERARQGFGPALVDASVYRYGPHSSADDDSVYRPAEEVAAWRERDPIPRYRRFLESRELWDEAAEEALEQEVAAQIDEAVKTAEAAGEPELAAMFDDVYAEMPWHLEEQREELER